LRFRRPTAGLGTQLELPKQFDRSDDGKEAKNPHNDRASSALELNANYLKFYLAGGAFKNRND